MNLRWTPTSNILHWLIRPLLHILSLLPFIALLIQTLQGNLGVNPVETLTHETGEWSLRFLLLTLLITPLIKISRNHWLIILRRPLGLYCFFYALLHFSVYWVFDQSLSFSRVLEDIAERPYITVGFTAFILLIPLVVTSTKKWRRRLAHRWNQLHRTIYLIGVAALVHLIWLTRADYQEAWIYGVLFLLLMTFRFNHLRGKPQAGNVR